MIYVYFYENIFQDKFSIMAFTFSNSTTYKLFIIYIFNFRLKPRKKNNFFYQFRGSIIVDS
jgi:hypothetical protein